MICIQKIYLYSLENKNREFLSHSSVYHFRWLYRLIFRDFVLYVHDFIIRHEYEDSWSLKIDYTGSVADSEIEGLSDEKNEDCDELSNSRTQEAGMYYLVMILILSSSIPYLFWWTCNIRHLNEIGDLEAYLARCSEYFILLNEPSVKDIEVIDILNPFQDIYSGNSNGINVIIHFVYNKEIHSFMWIFLIIQHYFV